LAAVRAEVNEVEEEMTARIGAACRQVAPAHQRELPGVSSTPALLIMKVCSDTDVATTVNARMLCILSGVFAFIIRGGEPHYFLISDNDGIMEIGPEDECVP
ncbi:hypothetical protein FOZ63_006043, partial [Perkinsus olseni]